MPIVNNRANFKFYLTPVIKFFPKSFQMKSSTTGKIIVLLMMVVLSCKKSEEVEPKPQEVKVNFTLTPDDKAGTYTLSKDSLDLTISVSSTIPDAGLLYQIEAKRSSGDQLIYKVDSNSKQNKLQLKIPGFGLKADYTVKVTVRSKNNPLNTESKTIQIIRNRIVVNFLKPSYELSARVKLWQDYPGGYATVAKLDYDGDGLQDYVWFEGYDVTKTYTWPGPIFEKFNGSSFVKQQITFPGTQLFAEKILVGDFNNDTYPDLFLVSHIDEWAGCTNCKPTPINPPHIIFNSANGFNRVKSFTDITGDWTPGCSGDIDKDGDLDVLLFSHHQDVSPTSRALINNGSGEFTYADYGISDIDWADRAELVDMNNDGFLDLIINDVVDENGYANRFRVLWGNGGPFSKANSTRILYSNQLFMISIAAEDLDNDGKRELITVGGRVNGDWEINIFKTTDYKAYQDITASSIQDNIKKSADGIMNGPIQVQDLNGDGKMDIFTADRRMNLIWQKDAGGVYKRKAL